MFSRLPNEIVDMIIDNCGSNKIKSYNFRYCIGNVTENDVKIIAANRIILWYKIMYIYKNLNRYITYHLKKIFSTWSYFPRNCVYYAPHIPNGMCRFCSNYVKDHKFKPSFIEKFFIIDQCDERNGIPK